VTTASQRLLLIAEFARRCRLPVSTLRYYDRIGLLHPSMVDPVSGYRRYAAEQLGTAITIARLRAIGVAPKGIADILAGGERGAAALDAQRRRIIAQIDERTHALTRLQELAAPPIPGPAGPRQVVDLIGYPVPVLAFGCGVAELPTTISRAVAKLRTRLRRDGVHPTGWGALLPLDVGDLVSGHVFARIDTSVADLVGPGQEMSTLPQGRAVRITHHGSADELPLSYHAALTEIDEYGAHPAGPVIEDYPDLGAGALDHPDIHVTVPMRPLTAPATSSRSRRFRP